MKLWREQVAFQSPVWQAMAVNVDTLGAINFVALFQSPVWQAMAVNVLWRHYMKQAIMVSITCMASHGGELLKGFWKIVNLMVSITCMASHGGEHSAKNTTQKRHNGFQSPVWQAMAVNSTGTPWSDWD